MALSHAQATEVAKRLNPGAGRMLWFADDGTLLSADAHRAVAEHRGEVYVCRRPATGGAVEVARVTAEEAASTAEPAFGVAW